MAIAIKTIPVLTGEMAERFVEMAEDSNHKALRSYLQISRMRFIE